MPLIEVDDQVFKALRDNTVPFTDRTDAARSAGEAQALWAKILGSATRHDALKLAKEIDPTLVIPEVDHPANAGLDALRKEFDEYKAGVEKEKEDNANARREADANDTVSKGRTWLRREKQLDDEGVAGVEKMMTDLSIPNYEVAFSHWRAQQPPEQAPLPSSTIGRNLDWFKAQEDQPDHAAMLKDPIAWRRQTILKTLQGIRSGELTG